MLALMLGMRMGIGACVDLIVCIADEQEFCTLLHMFLVVTFLVAFRGALRIADPALENLRLRHFLAGHLVLGHFVLRHIIFGHIVMRHRILLHRAAFHGVALRWLLGHGEQRHRETKRTKSTDCNKFLIHETNLPFGFSKPPEAGSAGQTEMRWSRGSYAGPPGFSARMHLLVCKNFG